MLERDEIISQNEVLEMARQAGMSIRSNWAEQELEAFAKLVAAKAIAKDREEFDIDELCARQNKIGYKQGYRAGQLAEREACAKVCDGISERANGSHTAMADDRSEEPILYMTGKELGASNCAEAIRARSGATSRGEA